MPSWGVITVLVIVGLASGLLVAWARQRRGGRVLNALAVAAFIAPLMAVGRLEEVSAYTPLYAAASVIGFIVGLAVPWPVRSVPKAQATLHDLA